MQSTLYSYSSTNSQKVSVDIEHRNKRGIVLRDCIPTKINTVIGAALVLKEDDSLTNE